MINRHDMDDMCGSTQELQFKEGDRIRIIGDSVDNFEFFSLDAEGVVERVCENSDDSDSSDMLVKFDTGEFAFDSEGEPCSWYVMNCDAELC